MYLVEHPNISIAPRWYCSSAPISYRIAEDLLRTRDQQAVMVVCTSLAQNEEVFKGYIPNETIQIWLSTGIPRAMPSFVSFAKD